MTCSRNDPDFEAQLGGVSLTTAEVCCHMPDARAVRPILVGQAQDLPPRFTKLDKLLDF
ncbi:MAG: hypothetical protein ACFB0F_17560 [Neomegalonema sp.]